MFTPQTVPLTEGQSPYDWTTQNVYQCTWYCFWRYFAVHGLYPTYQNRANKSGSYNNANTWLENYRDAIPMGLDYTPVAGDIAVYDYGEYGHVIFFETDEMTSEYRSGNPNSFHYERFGNFKGTLKGFLHCPYDSVDPVPRNEMVDQIETTDDTLRIRTEPNLNGEIVGHTKLGFYNVLGQKQATAEDMQRVEGLKCWYNIADNRWCANITTNYFPSDDDDFIKEFEMFVNSTKARIKAQEETIKEMKEDMSKISNISERWSK